MDVWKDFNRERISAEDFIVFIEIEQGCKNKYELDKETGLIILDRVLFTSTHYPMNYGFIPLTYSEDKDPLDVFVLCSQPIEKFSLVRCYPIGVVIMKDRDEYDEKIIAIPFNDPQYNEIKELEELPHHIIEELNHFLRVYKELENKKVEVVKICGRDEAVNTIAKSLVAFEELFGN